MEVVVLYCTVCERIGTGFHCSVIDRWAAATPNPPVARRYPPSSKIYWPILGIPVPSCRTKPGLKNDTEFCQLWSVPQKGLQPNLLVDTRQVEIVRLSQNNCGPMRQPSATRIPNGTTGK